MSSLLLERTARPAQEKQSINCLRDLGTSASSVVLYLVYIEPHAARRHTERTAAYSRSLEPLTTSVTVRLATLASTLRVVLPSSGSSSRSAPSPIYSASRFVDRGRPVGFESVRTLTRHTCSFTGVALWETCGRSSHIRLSPTTRPSPCDALVAPARTPEDNYGKADLPHLGGCTNSDGVRATGE